MHGHRCFYKSDSITGLLSKAEYTEKMYQYDRDELKKMKETVQELKILAISSPRKKQNWKR